MILTACGVFFNSLPLSMNCLVAPGAKCYEIFYEIVSQLAAPLNMVDLKIVHVPARLATPAIALQNFAAELAISFGGKPQARPLGTDSRQSVTLTFSMSCLFSGFRRPMTSRVRQGNRASWLPASRLTPARKSAQIISRQ